MLRKHETNLTAYVVMFLGAVYKYQHRILPDKEAEAMSVTHVWLSIFEVYRKETDVRFVYLIDRNAARKSAIHKSINRIDEM